MTERQAHVYVDPDALVRRRVQQKHTALSQDRVRAKS